jgi:hypothetical protein
MPGSATMSQSNPPTARDLNGHPQIPQGGLFNLPGITYWSEQIENNDQVTVVPLAATQVPVQFPANLTNTDILYREMIDVNISVTQALNAGTVFAAGAYNPYNYIGPMTLSMQNQFNTMDVPSGIDAKIFELVRPQYTTLGNDYWETNPQRSLNGQQALLSTFTSAPAFAGAPSVINFSLDIALGIWFDRYFDLDPDGQLRNLAPVRAFVTPQLMSGSNRIVTPRITTNAILAANNDVGPWVVNAAGPTAAGGLITFGWQRKIVYQPKAHTDTPILWGWQYSRETKQYSLSSRTTADIVLPTTGQLLMVYYRLFDPAAASGGAAIALSTVKNVWLQYGSGLFKYQDTALRAQRRFQRQHQNFLPPEGVIVHDMVRDEQGYDSNQNALNTLDTSSCKIHFDFNSQLSSSAYVWIGVEALRFVVQQ